jgi:hypothetical protein
MGDYCFSYCHHLHHPQLQYYNTLACSISESFIFTAQLCDAYTELAVLVVTLQTCIRELLGLNLSPNTSYPDWDFYGFTHSRHANARIGHRIDHDRVLSNPFQSRIHQSPYHPTVYSLDAVDVMKPTREEMCTTSGFQSVTLVTRMI